MKTKNKLLTITAILCAIVGTIACNDNKNPHKPQPIDTLEYKIPEVKGWGWKLIRMEVITDYDYPNRKIIDYSKYNIIYDFQFEKDYEKVDYHWTPPFKLSVHNYLSSTFYTDDIQSGGDYIYQYRQQSDNLLPNGQHVDYDHNLEIGDKYLYMGAVNSKEYPLCDIFETTDTISISNPQGTLTINNSYIGWVKFFVKIKDGDK